MAATGNVVVNSSDVSKQNFDIRTKSIEQTLVPLVSQITTLVNHREKPIVSSKTCRAVVRVGQAASLAVERFVAVGEAIADDHPEIRQDMYDACREAHMAGMAIAKLTDMRWDEQTARVVGITDKSAMIKAARSLLAAVTRVLVLADRVVVKQLLQVQDKVAGSLDRLEQVSNFTEFVNTFSQFGGQMVELAHLSGDRQNDLKDDKKKAQMGVARSILEKGTMMLLTSCKTCLRHPECNSARRNRDGVFRQIRQAMDLVRYVVSDGFYANGEGTLVPTSYEGNAPCLYNALSQFEDLVEYFRSTGLSGRSQDELQSALDAALESMQDFTDSAYTSHEHREQILVLSETLGSDLSAMLQVANKVISAREPNRLTNDLDTTAIKVLRTAKELRKQLQETAFEQGDEIFKQNADAEILNGLKNSGMSGDLDKIDELTVQICEHSEQLQETCKLLRHIAAADPLAVAAEHAENNFKILGPLIISASQTLATHPTSKIAKENMDVLCEAWERQINDVSVMIKEIADVCRGRVAADKQLYMSLPRPGKHGTTAKSLRPARLNAEEQAKIAKLGLEMKLITSEMDAETEKWEEAENDVVKRAKNMSSMAFSMYLFTRGEGPLRTTQDLFTQASYFAEEANKLHKSVNGFIYQVPTGTQKQELQSYLEKTPPLIQKLIVTIKSPTIGKAATFNKVDSVIQETKNLMNAIAKLVTTCLICATKYSIDYRGSPHIAHRWRHQTPMNVSSNGDDSMSSDMSGILRSASAQKGLHSLSNYTDATQ